MPATESERNVSNSLMYSIEKCWSKVETPKNHACWESPAFNPKSVSFLEDTVNTCSLTCGKVWSFVNRLLSRQFYMYMPQSLEATRTCRTTASKIRIATYVMQIRAHLVRRDSTDGVSRTSVPLPIRSTLTGSDRIKLSIFTTRSNRG